MKKVLSIALSIALTLSMLTSFTFASTSSANEVKYTSIDYSKTLSLNTATTGVLNDDDAFTQ